MKRFLIKIWKCESGAVSTDWVALTAAIVLFAVAIAATVKSSTVAAGETIGENVAAMATD
jgi:hypothetical protein